MYVNVYVNEHVNARVNVHDRVNDDAHVYSAILCISSFLLTDAPVLFAASIIS